MLTCIAVELNEIWQSAKNQLIIRQAHYLNDEINVANEL